jgi:transposase
MRCSKCGADNRETRKFCAQCGTPLTTKCPRCGASNEPAEDFCGECGTAILATQLCAIQSPAAGAVDGSDIQITPERADASPALDSEGKTVTALFSDIKGSMELMERMAARYPHVAHRCSEAAAIWLAEEAVRLKQGQSLRIGEQDILHGLAQAIRESGVDLTEMARECGVELIELRRKLALSRLGELLKPGEVWSLSDSELESKLQQAAAEYNLAIEELLDETSQSSAIEPGTVHAFALSGRADRLPHSLRCRSCRWLRPQPFKIDFKPYISEGFLWPREPAYACDRCLRMYLANHQVQQVERLTESEIPKLPTLRTWSAALAAIAILVLSGLYVFGSGAMEAARLLERSVSQSEVARRLGVHWQSAIRQVRQLEQEGPGGLKQTGQAGSRTRLNDPQLKPPEQALKRGRAAAGYASGVWTTRRVHTLIEELRGAAYHEAVHVWLILRRLGSSCQHSIGWALERVGHAIRKWKEVERPQIKKKPSVRNGRSPSSRTAS